MSFLIRTSPKRPSWSLLTNVFLFSPVLLFYSGRLSVSTFLAITNMALTLLPDEILESIVEHVIPEGFESLALTCKKFNSLCGPFLSQHNIRRARFYNLSYYTEWYTEPFQVRSAFDLIDLIAVEPIIARYVINADFSRDSWLTNGRPRAFNPDVRPEDFRIDPKLDCSGSIHNLLAASPYLTAAGLDWKQYWMTIDTDLENIEYRGYS